MSWDISRLSIGVGFVVEAIALCLIPLVLVRRKEPPSTAAWILALVFLPVVGATLFLLFGRERLRLPLQSKREVDRAIADRHRPYEPDPSLDAAPALLGSDVDREIFRVGQALARGMPTAGNTVELLVDGDATYAAIGRAIDDAEDHIYAEYYLIRPGQTADWFRDRLMAAAQRGVKVKLLIDGYGSFWLSRKWLRPLRAAGVQAAFFLPARLLLLQPMNLRNHRKILIADGKTGFTGGLNIGDEYRGITEPWRDTHARIEGPAVLYLSQIFAEDWHFATRRKIEPPAFDAPKPRCGTDDTQRREPVSRGGAVVAIVRSGPDLTGMEREAIHRLLFSAITRARERVLITTPYFIPDRAILVALQTAALRGVVVRLLLPGRSNHRFVSQAGRSFYEELLEAGVEVYEYGPGMIHAKTMVVDADLALVGSANMDLRSFRLNFEVHAVVQDAAFAARVTGAFEADLAVSRRIDLAQFSRRPPLVKLVQGAARLLSPLM